MKKLISIKLVSIILILLLLSVVAFAVDTTGRQALIFGAADTEKTLTYITNGLTHTIVVELPDWTNNSTATLSLINSDSKTLYSISALAENATYILLVERPLHETSTFKITLSGAPGGSGGTAYVTVYKR